MLSRDQCLRPDTWTLSETQGNVFGSPRAVIHSSQTPYQGILHSWNQNATGGNPVRDSTGRLVAKSDTIPLPSFARKPSFCLIIKVFRYRSFSLGIYPLHHHLCFGREDSKNKATTCSSFPSEATSWIQEVEMVDLVDDF